LSGAQCHWGRCHLISISLRGEPPMLRWCPNGRYFDREISLSGCAKVPVPNRGGLWGGFAHWHLGTFSRKVGTAALSLLCCAVRY
jgi:hypothetical protein